MLFKTGCTNEEEACYSIFTSAIPRITASITNYEFIDPSAMQMIKNAHKYNNQYTHIYTFQ